MSIETRHLQTLVELWARKDEPETADLQRALHLTKVFEGQASTPTHLRAFVWHLVIDTHRAVDWIVPSNVSLASCRSAAASMSHASSLLTSEITEEISGDESPVLLLGALAASYSIFGRWDLLPSDGALLVSLESEEIGLRSSTSRATSRGIHWAAPGRLRPIYEKHTVPATLNGRPVLVPSPELVTGRSRPRTLKPEDPEALIFFGAAFASASSKNWPEVIRIAKALGHAKTPIDLAVQLGIDHQLGLGVGKIRRSYLTLRRMSRSG